MRGEQKENKALFNDTPVYFEKEKSGRGKVRTPITLGNERHGCLHFFYSEDFKRNHPLVIMFFAIFIPDGPTHREGHGQSVHECELQIGLETYG